MSSKLWFEYNLEKFTAKAENKIYRSMLALDSLMCQVENDLEDLMKEKKFKSSSSSSESDEENSETDSSASFSDSD